MWKCNYRASLACALVASAFSLGAAGQKQKTTVTIAEPAPVKVDDLFNQADLVAEVRILSGDTENYPRTVYKAAVLKSFKGPDIDQNIYFGPFVGYGLGYEMIVFLRRSPEVLEPRSVPKVGPSYGPIAPFYLIMYEGYSALDVRYECVFDGVDTAHQCDYGVKLNTYQVRLPKSLKTFPPPMRGATNDETKWVRKSELVAYLEKLAAESRR
jgi:hypothetical protein